MPLFRVIKKYKNGYISDQIEWEATTVHQYTPENDVVSNIVQLFQYECASGIIPPTIVSLNNKTYILPSWIECHPKTTLKDVKWTPPQPVQDKVKETFESKSGLGEYKTTYNPNNKTFRCSCMGYFRAKDRQCKHIKALKEKMKL